MRTFVEGTPSAAATAGPAFPWNLHGLDGEYT